MSVELQEQRVRYVGNGTAKNFPFGFTIEEPSQVQVVRADAKGTETTLVLNQDYSVALNSDGTGSVTLAQALPTDYVLALVSNIEIDQERAFYNNTPYYQEQIEGGLDKLTRICQQLHELAMRHFTVPPTSSTKPAELLADIFTAQRESIESAASAASSAAAAGASAQGAASYLAQTQQAKGEAVAVIQAQQSASESAVEQAGDAQAVRLEQLASNILVSGTAYNKEATVTLDQPIAAGAVVSLPVADDGQQMMYRVGASTLRMGFNGTLLFCDEQFAEVGGTGSLSTSVKLLFDAVAGDVLNFFVYAQNVTVVVDEESGLSIDDQKRLSAAGIKAVADAAQSTADSALSKANAASGRAAVLPGTVIAWAANSAPSGYLLCNGAAVSRTTYAKLFETIGTTYGAGDSSTTFNLPNLTDRFIQGHGTAGAVKAAGLPNLKGYISGMAWRSENPDAGGVFEMTTTYTSAAAGDKKGVTSVSFDASRSNSTYGASTTVQPPALTMRYYIKY